MRLVRRAVKVNGSRIRRAAQRLRNRTFFFTACPTTVTITATTTGGSRRPRRETGPIHFEIMKVLYIRIYITTTKQ